MTDIDWRFVAEQLFWLAVCGALAWLMGLYS